MLAWADAMDYAFRALAFINILLLLLMFVRENQSTKREKLTQKKLDLIGMAAGLSAEFGALDHKYGRETGMGELDSMFPDTIPR